ncbi:hypothetical protein BJ166DRAFT_372505 [Pestalotiopsis sp. NC0098]|nr:hypothetical protein BJ166DRAFT_372505 [Pestalotiopsis sp. NC0098]
MRDPRAVPNLLSPVASCMICNPSDQAQELWRSNAVVYLLIMLCECKVIPSAARSRPNRQRCRALFNLALNWVQPTRQVMCQESRAFMTSKKRCDLSNKEKGETNFLQFRLSSLRNWMRLKRHRPLQNSGTLSMARPARVFCGNVRTLSRCDQLPCRGHLSSSAEPKVPRVSQPRYHFPARSLEYRIEAHIHPHAQAPAMVKSF